MTRPLNLGLIDAISRVGGFESPELPSLLPGIQPVIVYGDLSRGVTSDLFEARGICADNLSAFTGIELAAVARGGVVVEEIAALVITAGQIPLLCVNIVAATASVGGIAKLDCGGIPTTSTPSRIPAGLPFGAQVPVVGTLDAPGLIMYTARQTTRFVVPTGSFFQWFPTVVPPPLFTVLNLVWRELADIQGEA